MAAITIAENRNHSHHQFRFLSALFAYKYIYIYFIMILTVIANFLLVPLLYGNISFNARILSIAIYVYCTGTSGFVTRTRMNSYRIRTIVELGHLLQLCLNNGKRKENSVYFLLVFCRGQKSRTSSVELFIFFCGERTISTFFYICIFYTIKITFILTTIRHSY